MTKTSAIININIEVSGSFNPIKLKLHSAKIYFVDY